MLLQPNFVLPEFFMHVQFPDVFREGATGDSHASNSGAAAVSDAGKVAASPSRHAADSHGSETDSAYNGSSNSSSSSGGVFALDILSRYHSAGEVLLGNEMSSRRSKQAGADTPPAPPPVGSGSPTKTGSSSGFNPRDALMRKQSIVVALHESLQTVQAQSAALLSAHARKITKLVGGDGAEDAR